MVFLYAVVFRHVFQNAFERGEAPEGGHHVLRIYALGASAVKNYRVAPFHRRGKGDQGLHRLIEVDVQRASRRDEVYVGAAEFDSEKRAQEFHALQMRGFHTSGEYPERRAFRVLHDVDAEVYPQRLRRFQHIEMHRVAVEVAGDGARIEYHFGPVVVNDAAFARDAGQHRFTPARKAGELVRLYFSYRYAQRGAADFFVELDAVAEGGPTDRHELFRVVGVVVFYAHAAVISARDFLHLFLRRAAVHSRRYDEQDVFLRYAAGRELLHHVRKDGGRSDGAGRVGYQNHGVLFAGCELAEAQRTYRVFQRAADERAALLRLRPFGVYEFHAGQRLRHSQQHTLDAVAVEGPSGVFFKAVFGGHRRSLPAKNAQGRICRPCGSLRSNPPPSSGS